MTDVGFLPGLYEHYKGGVYRALHLVEHHETGELFVVYVSMKHGSLHLREWASVGKDSWTDQVVSVQTKPASMVQRFRYVGP
jgi:hypothetical protein